MNIYSVSKEISIDDLNNTQESTSVEDIIREESILELLSHLLYEPSFDQLRTKEQLGYIVNTSSTTIAQHLYLRIIGILLSVIVLILTD